jgi:heme/copper-type cytochrome/quinol oxidase subunit 2
MGKQSNIIFEEFNSIKFDTWYHAGLSIAIIMKLFFFISAIVLFYDERAGKQDSKQFKRMMMLKNFSNEMTKIIVCLLIIVVFATHKGVSCIDKHFRILLVVFAIISLLEVHWIVFFQDVIPLLNQIQYFTGRIGTLQDQTNMDKIHAVRY